MGDAENCHRMDSSNSNSSDEPGAAEKKMKVDESVAPGGSLARTEGVSSSPSQSSDAQKANGNANADNVVSTSQDAVAVSEEIDEPVAPVPAEPEPLKITSSSVEQQIQDAIADKQLEDAEVKKEEGELVELKVVFNKKQLNIKSSLGITVGDLKKLIEAQTKVAPALQKVLIKGIAKDDSTLKSLAVTKSTKILVIGSSLDEVMAMSKPPDKEALVAEEAKAIKESSNWCSLTQHKKVIDKGVPDDVMPGILNDSEPLPEIPLFGMLSSKAAKVRLTFKLEADELWIGTKERTEKLAISTIRNVTNQPITGYEHYHIIAIQLGPTEASRFFVYWVPAQYVDAIKDALGS